MFVRGACIAQLRIERLSETVAELIISECLIEFVGMFAPEAGFEGDVLTVVRARPVVDVLKEIRPETIAASRFVRYKVVHKRVRTGVEVVSFRNTGKSDENALIVSSEKPVALFALSVQQLEILIHRKIPELGEDRVGSMKFFFRSQLTDIDLSHANIYENRYKRIPSKLDGYDIRAKWRALLASAVSAVNE